MMGAKTLALHYSKGTGYSPTQSVQQYNPTQ